MIIVTTIWIDKTGCQCHYSPVLRNQNVLIICKLPIIVRVCINVTERMHKTKYRAWKKS